MSAASVWEASLVIEGELGEEGSHELDLLLLKADIEVIAFTHEQLTMARHGFRKYGKGRHPAALNMATVSVMPSAKPRRAVTL